MNHKDTVQTGYNAIAAAYLAARRVDSDDVRLLDELVQRLPPGARILDAGCGAGVPVTRALSRSFRVVGVDFAVEQLRRARGLVPQAQFVCQDLSNLGFPDASFDAICSYYAVIHIPRHDHEELLRHFHRLLKPSGLALLCLGAEDLESDFVADYLGAPMYWSHYDAQTNLALLDACGFALIWSRRVADATSPGAGHLFVLVQRVAGTDGTLPAGDFSSWLHRFSATLVEQGGMDVPCGECTACCTSAHFVHIRPEETRTLARIPPELLFAAPGRPRGHRVLGYDENGRCPMLIEGRCSIYEDRPLTCRNYDCRVFAAAEMAADKDLITQRTQCWKFSHPTKEDRAEHAAVRDAAKFLQTRADCFPGGAVPRDPAQIAILAIKVHEVFLAVDDESARTGRSVPGVEIAQAVMKANEVFEARRDPPEIPHPNQKPTAPSRRPRSKGKRI